MKQAIKKQGSILEQNKINITPLDRTTATIVYIMKEVGILHYNKITYLFEYFFIKNFGERYTKEKFIKLPHGPVISNYKKQIINLANLKLFDTDVKKISENSSLDDAVLDRIPINENENTGKFIIKEKMVFSLLKRIIDKYGYLPKEKIEEIVYKTPPVKNYLRKVKTGFKRRETGGYILTDCIRMSDYKNPITKGRMLALKHLQKYPHINYKLQKELAEEFSDLEKLRPAF